VLSTPLDHSITQGVPGDRRKFIDSVIAQASSTYLQILIDYNRTLKQRSSLLQSIKETKNYALVDELDAWTEKLLQGGLEIIKHRVTFIKNFHPFVRNSYYKIMGEDEEPKITYYFLNDTSEDDIENRFKTLLNERHNEELRRAINLVGPHRDNFIFGLNGLNLKTYGSQGQHKTFQAVLRFAEFCYLKEVTGKSPLFLLDDVFGELDANRASKISEYLGDVGQAFITLTDFGNFSFLKITSDDKLIKLNRGEVVNA
jgi:DNA replication and repair protein RecF